MTLRSLVVAGFAVGLLALPAAALARDGFYADLGLGAGDGNFDIDAEEGSDVGGIIEAQLGYAFANGFGIGGGLSGSTFAYKIQLLGQDVADLELSFLAIDLTLNYFIELNRDWELTLRGGVSSTRATAAISDGDARIESDDDSAGVFAAFGAAWFVGEDFALRADLFHRTYGVAFQSTGEKEITMSGLLLGVRWR